MWHRHAFAYGGGAPGAAAWRMMGARHHGRCGPPRHAYEFGPPFGGPWGRRRRMRRGDVRAALLVLLDEEPRNGYGLMQEIERRSEGAWRPSPGSVYPALQQLEDEGLVRAQEEDGRRVFTLTDDGRAHVEERRAELGEPWADLAGDDQESVRDLRGLARQVAAALLQVAASGSDEQIAQARKVLLDARKALYRILAEDDEAAT